MLAQRSPNVDGRCFPRVTCTLRRVRKAGSIVFPALAAPWPRRYCVAFACRHRLNTRSSTRIQQCRLDSHASANRLSCSLTRFGTTVGYTRTQTKATFSRCSVVAGFFLGCCGRGKRHAMKDPAAGYASIVATRDGISSHAPDVCTAFLWAQNSIQVISRVAGCPHTASDRP